LLLETALDSEMEIDKAADELQERAEDEDPSQPVGG
jgi:hypothetical protein